MTHVAIKSFWQKPIAIARSIDERQLGLVLPIGVMIRNPAGGTGGAVNSVNGQTGTVVLDAADVGADPAGTAAAVGAGKANVVHGHTIGDVGGLAATLGNKADLVGGFIPTSQIPAVAITEFLGYAASEAEMLTLVGQRGDWCIRSDVSSVYVIIDDDYTQSESWLLWPYPMSPVTSVNGQVGVIVLSKADIGLGNVPNVDARARSTHTGTQPASTITGLAPVATSGSYNDLSDKPDIGGVRKFAVGYWYNQQALAHNTASTYSNGVSYYSYFVLPHSVTISKLNAPFSAGAAGRSVKVRFYSFLTGAAVSSIYEWAAITNDVNEFTLPSPLVLPAGQYFVGLHNNGANAGNQTLRSIDPQATPQMPTATVQQVSGSTPTGLIISSTYAAGLPDNVPVGTSLYTGNQPVIGLFIAG